ncbi:MAG: 3'(2'),5'-bisphosphate nucleotidase CysQ [Thermodesulfobacteriota bacterium]
MSSAFDLDLALALAELAQRAGKEIMAVYATDFEVEIKADDSPLTRADRASHDLVKAELEKMLPDVPLVSEEGDLPSSEERARWTRHLLLDPLDGTKEFVKRNGEFTVNIGIVEGTRPLLGVVHAPAPGLTYLGGPGLGAFRLDDGRPVPVRALPAPAREAVVVVSRSHPSPELQRYLDALDSPRTAPHGAAFKFCKLAEGSAHLYPRLGPTMEWDTAAGQAILEGAGGAVLTWDGAPLAYNKPDLRNPGFLARGPLA